MAEIRTLTTLTAKLDEIESAIANYEARLAQARADLSHVNAVISIFEATGERDATKVYTDSHRLFQCGELTAICKAALAQHGPMNTRALSVHILAAKGLDASDKVLAKSVGARLIHSLRMQENGENKKLWAKNAARYFGDVIKGSHDLRFWLVEK